MAMAMAARGRPSPRAPARAQARTSGPMALLSKFSKLSPKKANKGLLVDELLRLTRDCDAGFNTRPAEREQISSIVQELSAFCPKNPLSRPELLGRWEVRYASKPTTAGGPFKTLPGRIVFPGQVAIQEIQEPDIIINEINFKTLGFVPGSVTQVGTITPVSGSAFEIEFPNSTKRVGGPQKRTIELLYLDQDIRIARAIPREEGQEGSFYVFQREGIEFELDDQEEEEEREKREGRDEGVKASRTRDQAVAAEGRAAAAARAKEEREAAAERARAEREALASRKAMAKELFADLSSAARESALLAQSSAKELAELEREGARMERGASSARMLIEKSEAVVRSLVDRLEESQTDEAALEKELRASQGELSQVRAELAKTKKALSFPMRS
mmetsp:Transcript_1069/g.3292  ORF Transcript_1069/g.3292 Transcript_1069/m.3292 type:complete len:389 (+) Transcript_1069:662-1828(+)